MNNIIHSHIMTESFDKSYFVEGFFVIKTDNLEKKVKLLSVLVDGRKKHPAGRAIHPATGHCKPCVDMW